MDKTAQFRSNFASNLIKLLVIIFVLFQVSKALVEADKSFAMYFFILFVGIIFIVLWYFFQEFRR